MRTLCLLEQLPYEVGCPIVQPFALKQLRVSQDRRQRIVQLVGHARDQLAHRRHLLALQQLLLRLAQVFISLAGFFVEADLLDSRRQLAPYGNHHVLVVAAVGAGLETADPHDPDRVVLAPQQHPDPRSRSVCLHKVRDQRRQVRQKLCRQNFGPRPHHQVAKSIGELDRVEACSLLGPLAPSGPPPERGFIRV